MKEFFITVKEIKVGKCIIPANTQFTFLFEDKEMAIVDFVKTQKIPDPEYYTKWPVTVHPDELRGQASYQLRGYKGFSKELGPLSFSIFIFMIFYWSSILFLIIKGFICQD